MEHWLCVHSDGHWEVIHIARLTNKPHTIVLIVHVDLDYMCVDYNLVWDWESDFKVIAIIDLAYTKLLRA